MSDSMLMARDIHSLIIAGLTVAVSVHIGITLFAWFRRGAAQV